MTTMEKPTYHHGDLANALVASVRVLIDRDGITHFSISEACKMAGVSTAAPYKHFRDKQAILEAVALQGFKDMGEAMRDARDRAKQKSTCQPGDSIIEIGKAYVHFAVENRGTFRLLFGSNPNVKENCDVNETGHNCFSILIEEVAELMGLAADDVLAKKRAVILWTFVHGAASLLIDRDYDTVEIPVDVDAMIAEATPGLLGLTMDE